MLTENSIAFKYRRTFVSLFADSSAVVNPRAHTIAIEMTRLGFVPTQRLIAALTHYEDNRLIEMFNDEYLPILREARGAHVAHKPMYPNFPQQVAEASEIELFMNAIVHYWTNGAWTPEYRKMIRPSAKSEIKNLIEVDVINIIDFYQIFTDLCAMNESWSETDRETVVWFLDNVESEFSPTTDYKENMCFLAGQLLNRGYPIVDLVDNATDVLRIATAMSDGDVSLASNTKFKSFPRKVRRELAIALEKVATEEDINRHRGKWTRLFHAMHIGDYSQKLYQIAAKIRGNKKIETFNSRVEAAIDGSDLGETLNLLMDRPGEFARRLDVLLRTAHVKQHQVIVSMFKRVANKVNTRVLVQLRGHFASRYENTSYRVAFPKGNVQKAMLLDGQHALPHKTLDSLISVIDTTLKFRFQNNEELGKVFVDVSLADCPVPTQTRSMSDSLFQVARGTRLPINGDGTTLRFFIYWKGQDIDLSATMHDENFKNIGHVSYTRLRDSEMKAYHSGDITRAPDGASEFIDIDIDSAIKQGARYIAMNVMVFSGPTFAQHEECFAGWMTRSKPKSNQIYDPTTVDQKVDLRSQSKNAVPVFFDLVNRQAIWVDMSTHMRNHYGGNNVESNMASIEQTIHALVDTRNKMSLYDLFLLHAEARGELVSTPEEADISFGWDGDVTPYDISKITSEYL